MEATAGTAHSSKTPRTPGFVPPQQLALLHDETGDEWKAAACCALALKLAEVARSIDVVAELTAQAMALARGEFV